MQLRYYWTASVDGNGGLGSETGTFSLNSLGQQVGASLGNDSGEEHRLGLGTKEFMELVALYLSAHVGQFDHRKLRVGDPVPWQIV